MFTYHTFLDWIIEYESQRQNSFRANYLQWRNAFQRCKLQRYEPIELKMFKEPAVEISFFFLRSINKSPKKQDIRRSKDIVSVF